MPSVLTSKKKAELQDIAKALGLKVEGTKEDLCAKIRDHLDSNQSDLEENPQFSGLYSKRRRVSAKPPSSVKLSNSPTRPKHRVIPFGPIYESTPVKDLREISAILKAPVDQTPANVKALTPTRIPLPETPDRSIIDYILKPQEIVQSIKLHERNLLHNGREFLLSLRMLLSSSQNIWSLTACGEFLYILYSTLIYRPLQIPLSNHSPLPDVTLTYPQWENFQSPSFWLVLIHWAIPTLIAPIIAGLLVSFHPVTRTGDDTAAIAPLDYLTASIVRLAAHVLYPYDGIQFDRGLYKLDILGFKWRVLAASVGVAFAFAEAISLAPEAVAHSYALYQQSPGRRQLGSEDPDDEDDDSE